MRNLRLNLKAASWLGALSGVLVVGACSSKADTPQLNSSPPDGLEWKEGGPSFLSEVRTTEPYTGDDSSVAEAQARLPTGSALHSEVILRSCGPLGGVCHNRKEYPDLRSPSNFLATIGAPCNIQSGTPEGVFDRCERTGDAFSFGDSKKSYEIGWIEVIPGDYVEDASSEDMPGLHIYLGDAVDSDDFPEYYSTAHFTRTFVTGGQVEDLGYANYSGRWQRFDEGRHIAIGVQNYRVDRVNALLQSGIQQGDMNRNGIFGARPNEDGEILGGISLIEPGSPETSYLAARLRGHMQGETVPGTRMPLANPPFSIAEMISFFCFIEGIPADGVVNLESDIDYKNCSYAEPDNYEALAIEGAGKNWSDRVSPLLQANCGGCHSAERAEGDFVLVGDDILEFLLSNNSPTDPMGRPFIAPGDPSNSYLYLKLINDPSIDGKGMPVDPIKGDRTLSDEELADIEAWIRDGAAP